MHQNIFGEFSFAMGRPLSAMGSRDRCSRTERCTFAAVICENLNYKFQIASPETLQNKLLGEVFDVMGLHQLHQNIPEEDKRATTNVQMGLAFFFLFSFALFLSL